MGLSNWTSELGGNHRSTPYRKSIEHVKIVLMIWTTLEGEGSCLMAVNIAPLLIKLLLSPGPTLNTATWGIQTMFGECNLSHSWYTFCVSGALDLRQMAVFEIFLSCCCFYTFTDLRNSISIETLVDCNKICLHNNNDNNNIFNKICRLPVHWIFLMQKCLHASWSDCSLASIHVQVDQLIARFIWMHPLSCSFWTRLLSTRQSGPC